MSDLSILAACPHKLECAIFSLVDCHKLSPSVPLSALALLSKTYTPLGERSVYFESFLTSCAHNLEFIMFSIVDFLYLSVYFLSHLSFYLHTR